MIRIALCDDSTESLNKIASLMNHWNPNQFSLERFEDGDSLIQAHFTSAFDIILIDVLMPLLNGIETAKEIRQKDKNVKIVFITSSIEYAYDSYSVKASDYILKPVDDKKLYNCLNELCQQLHTSSRSISVSSSGITHRIAVNSIETLEAQNKHVLFTLNHGQKIISNEPLYFYEKMLLEESCFFKCHRSFIINLYQISSYSTKGIIMHSGKHIPVSRNLYKDFENAYFSSLFEKVGESR